MLHVPPHWRDDAAPRVGAALPSSPVTPLCWPPAASWSPPGGRSAPPQD